MTSLLELLKPSFPHTVLKGFSKNLNHLRFSLRKEMGPLGPNHFFFSFGLLVPQGKDFNLEFSTWKLGAETPSQMAPSAVGRHIHFHILLE